MLAACLAHSKNSCSRTGRTRAVSVLSKLRACCRTAASGSLSDRLAAISFASAVRQREVGPSVVIAEEPSLAANTHRTLLDPRGTLLNRRHRRASLCDAVALFHVQRAVLLPEFLNEEMR